MVSYSVTALVLKLYKVNRLSKRFWPWCEVERLIGVWQLSGLCNEVRIRLRRAAYDWLSVNNLGIRLVKMQP